MSDLSEPIEVVVSSDFICPWCWIGHRRLSAGITLAGLKVPPIVRYLPYEINPQMPAEGMSRRQYRSAKFGSWARSQAMDDEAVLAGRGVGTEFNFDRIEITPNTRLAHRLMILAQQKGRPGTVEALIEGLFSAYFTRGRDIGALEVVVSVAADAGLDADEARTYLEGTSGDGEVMGAGARCVADGVRSLPTVRIDGTQVSGAQPAAVLAEALRAAEAKKAAESKK